METKIIKIFGGIMKKSESDFSQKVNKQVEVTKKKFELLFSLSSLKSVLDSTNTNSSEGQ